MQRFRLILFLSLFTAGSAYSQVLKPGNAGLLFHGAVFDASSFKPLTGSHIIINSLPVTLSDEEGRFAFRVFSGDTVVFTRLGYKPVVLNISDTLSGKEYVSGIYMHADTIEIEEVVIMPRYSGLRSEMFTSRPESNIRIENARYNLEVSSYQGRMGISKLGDPSTNYEVLRNQQKSEAYTKGQIPSDRIVGLSPFMLIPAAYLLMNGLPEKPSPLKPQLTEQEVDHIHKTYLERMRIRE